MKDTFTCQQRLYFIDDFHHIEHPDSSFFDGLKEEKNIFKNISFAQKKNNIHVTFIIKEKEVFFYKIFYINFLFYSLSKAG